MRMKKEEFEVKTYGKSELAMLYFPDSSKNGALKQLRNWFRINARLRYLLGLKGRNFTPKQVQEIIDEEGPPY